MCNVTPRTDRSSGQLYFSSLHHMVICNNFQVKRARGADTPPPPPPPSLLAYPLRNKAICSNTNRSRLREREREESMLFIFLYFGPSMQRGIIGLVDEFRSRWIFLGKTLIFIPIVILFETSRRFKMTYSLYSNIYIYDSLNTRSFTLPRLF